MIYLDHAATTKTDPAAAEAMLPFLTEQYFNPSAFYQPAVRTRMQIEEKRRKIAALLGVPADTVFFTSGGTESDNWAIRLAAELSSARGKHIISSAVEHPAVKNTLHFLETKGFEATLLPVGGNGRISLEELEAAIRPDTVLITVMHANNEVGTVQPVREIGEIASAHGILFHTDAVQTFGHIPVPLEEGKIDLLSASAHKLYGPKGVGLMYVRDRKRFGKLLFGGSQEKSLRPGTENTAGIAGFAKAAELAFAGMAEEGRKEERLRKSMLEKLAEAIPGTRANGDPEHRLPGILSVTFPEKKAESLLIGLDQAGICASAGSACSTGALEPSHVLLACGLSKEEAERTIRFSFGRENTMEDVDQTVRVLKQIYDRGKESR